MRPLDQLRDLTALGLHATRAIRDAGVMHPVRPDRAARLFLAYARYGPTPATLGAMSALRFPTRTALIDEQGALTYAELEHRAAALATKLQPLTTQKIGILCRNHRGFVEAVLAASRLGNDVVLLNTDFAPTQLGQVAERERIGLLLHDDEFTQTIKDSGYKNQTLQPQTTETPSPQPVHPTRTSKIIVMTSGTTGTPKGASHDLSIRSVLPAALSHLNRVPVRSGAPIVVAPPLFHILGFAYTTVALGMGLPLILNKRFDAHETLKSIEKHHAETLVAVPVMLQRILDEKKPRPETLRTVVCGGAALHPHLSTAFMDHFGDVLVNVYGATETGWATIATPTDLREAPGTVGRPSFRLTIKILDENNRELPPGETGEIYTSGGLRFAGYTGGGDKHRNHHDNLTSTGDLGHFDDQGRLFIDGRADDMIVSGGENVFPGEVETLLDAHPDIAEVSVTGVEDNDFGHRLAAHIVRKPESNLTADEVKAHVREHLARYKVPRDVHFVAELPRTSTGKVKSRALKG
ncbi:AMP-binding protein [Actinomadura decatromicini]|nr:AMP-binding protein [Actinomadura decatromicini]